MCKTFSKCPRHLANVQVILVNVHLRFSKYPSKIMSLWKVGFWHKRHSIVLSFLPATAQIWSGCPQQLANRSASNEISRAHQMRVHNYKRSKVAMYVRNADQWIEERGRGCSRSIPRSCAEFYVDIVLHGGQCQASSAPSLTELALCFLLPSLHPPFLRQPLTDPV